MGEAVVRWAEILSGRLLLLVVALTMAGLPVPVRGQSWYSTSWPYRKTLTVASSNVTATLTNFPVLVSLVDADLQARARTNAQDLVFTAADGETVLAHEVESYGSATGALVAWVRVPLLSSATHTVLHLYYGHPATPDRANPTQVWDADHVGVWHLGEDPSGASPQHRDSTAFGNHGESMGGRTSGGQVAGQLGWGQDLDGVDDRISVPSSPSLQLGTNGTLEIWFKRGSTGTWGGLVAKGDRDSEPDHSFNLEIDPSDYVYYALGTGTGNASFTGNFRISDTTAFHQLQFTWNGSQARLYYDGVPKRTNSLTAVPVVNAAPVLFGQWGVASDRFDGILDEIRISKSPRSADWIATQYRNQSAPGSFVVAGAETTNAAPYVVVGSIHGGVTPTAGIGFNVRVDARNADGTARAVATETQVALSLAGGSGTLGGTLTGTIPAGASSVTLVGVTYTRAESGVLVRAQRTSGEALGGGDGSPFAVDPGPVSALVSTVTARPSSVEANGVTTAAVTVNLKDAFGNGVAGKGVALAAASGSSTIHPATAVSDSSGAAVFVVKNAVAETVVYSALDQTDAISLAGTASVTFVRTPWYSAGWGYRKLISIESARVTGTHSNFPVLVRVTDAELQAHARTDAGDVLFTSGDGTNRLAHEIESYTPSTGTLVAWVKVPTLSSAADTRLFLYYGHAFIGDRQDRTNVWDGQYRAVWHAGEGGGTVMRDATSNANDATLASAPRTPTWSAAGKVGGTLSFDGANDLLNLPHSESLNITGTGLTISGWFRLQDTGTDQVIFGKFWNPDLSYPWYQYGFEFDTDANQFDLFVGSDGSLYGPFSTAPAIGQWVHAAFTYDGTNVVGYLDGEIRTSSAQNFSISPRTQPLRLGLDLQDSQPYWGEIDELRVSSVARSAAWLRTEYVNHNAPADFAQVSAGETRQTGQLSVVTVNGGVEPVAGQAFTVQVAARDAGGFPVAVSTDTPFVLTLATGQGTPGGTLTGVLLSGTETATLGGVVLTVAQTGAILRASPTGGDALTPGESAPFAVVPGAVSAGRCSVTANPASVEANGFSASTVEVVLRDAQGNAVPGRTVSLVAGSGSSEISPASAVTDASGRVAFSVRDSVAEAVTYTATVVTDAVVLGVTPTVTFYETPWFNGAWSHRKLLTVASDLVAGSLTDFPVLVRVADGELASLARTNAHDVVFTAADGVTPLAHEVESYDAATGELLAWVKVPVLSEAADTILFLYYGNPAATDRQDRAAVWDAGFRGVWHGGEGSGTGLGDSSAHGNDGTLSAGGTAPTWDEAGPIGHALSFTNGVGYVGVPHSSSLDIAGTQFSISAWLKIGAEGTGNDQVIVAKFHNSTMTSPWYQYAIEFGESSQQVNLYLSSSGGLQGPWGVTPPKETWVQVAFTYDGASVRSYLNGVEIASSAHTAAILSRTQPLHIGRANENQYPFLGSIDELRLSAAVRSPTWIATEYANQSDPAAFVRASGGEVQSLPRLTVASVNGGASPAADASFAVEVQSRTAGGSLYPVAADTAVSLVLGEGNGTLGGTVVGTIPAGTSSVILSAVTYTRAESGVVLTATRTGGDVLSSGDSGPFTVVAGAVSASRSSVLAGSSTVPANGASTAVVNVTLRDAHDNPVSGRTVSLVAGGGHSVVSGSGGPTAADGMATFTVRDTYVESVVYTATSQPDGTTLAQTATVDFVRPAWFDTAWQHRKALVVDKTKVAGSLGDFPMLVSLSDTNLASSALTNGWDLLFTADDGVTRLWHQVESYTNVGGVLNAWVRVPALSTHSDTGIYLYYGNPASTNQARATNVWDSGYRAVWHLAGSDFRDSTAYGNNGTNSGTTATSGRIGEGRSFNGSNNYVYSTTRYTDPQTFTLETWFKTSTASGRNLFNYENNRTGTGSTRWDRMVWVGTDGRLYFECWSGASDVIATSGTYTDNAWHQMVAVRDDATDTMSLYVDGQWVGSTYNALPEVNNGYWRLGAYKAGSTQAVQGYFPGAMDEARISFVARSADWVLTQYRNQGSPGTFYSVGSQENRPATSLSVDAVHGGVSPEAGASFTLTVRALDGLGQPAAVAADTALALAVKTGGGALGGVVTATLPRGSNVVTLSGLSYTRAESGVVLTASRTSGDVLTSGDSAAFTVTAGAVDRLQLLMPGETADPGSVTGRTGTPGGQTAGSPVTVSVRAVDAHWNLVTTVTDLVRITSSDAGATLPSDAALVGGARTFSVTFAGNGNQTVTASDLSVPSVAAGTGSPTAITGGTSGPATQLGFAMQPSLATAGSALGQQPVVQSRDANGNPSTVGLPANLIVTVHLHSGTGTLQGTASLDIGTAAGNGVASYGDLRIDARGSKVLRAEASGLSAATSDPFVVANVSPVGGTVDMGRPKGVPVRIRIAQLLAAASDVNGDALSVAGVSALSTNGAAVRTNAVYLLADVPPGGHVADRVDYTLTDGEGTGTGVLRIAADADAASLPFNRIAYGLVGGKPTAVFVGIPGRSYHVQRSMDPPGDPTWTTLIVTNAPAGGRFLYTDETPPDGTPMYRAIHQ